MRTKSGLEVGKWVQQLVDSYEQKGIIKEWLIRVKKNRKLTKAKVADLDPVYHDYLRTVQVQDERVLSPKVDVADKASMKRGPWRGLVAQAQNVNIPPDIIKANARWQKVERAMGHKISQLV